MSSPNIDAPRALLPFAVGVFVGALFILPMCLYLGGLCLAHQRTEMRLRLELEAQLQLQAFVTEYPLMQKQDAPGDVPLKSVPVYYGVQTKINAVNRQPRRSTLEDFKIKIPQYRPATKYRGVPPISPLRLQSNPEFVPPPRYFGKIEIDPIHWR